MYYFNVSAILTVSVLTGAMFESALITIAESVDGFSLHSEDEHDANANTEIIDKNKIEFFIV